jgi:tetratricopeptide (TPR) repeat protein
MVANAGERGSLHVKFGRAYRDAGYMDDAVKEFRRALQIDPKTLHANYFIGLIRLIKNEWAPLPEIRDSMLAELKINPRHYLANYVLGVFASNAKDYAASERYLSVAVEEQPLSPEPWLYKGLNAYSQGKMDEAEALLRKAVALTGNDEARSHYQIRKAYIALGRILIQSGRREEATEWMQKARRVQQLGMNESQQSIAETFASAGVGMGAVLPYIPPEERTAPQPMGEVDITAPLDDATLTKMPEQERKLTLAHDKQLRVILGTSYNDLGTAHARSQQYSSALNYFREAERWDRSIPNLVRNIGVAAFRTGEYAETVRALSEQVQQQPADDAARSMLGIAYFMTGAFAEAVRTISPLGEKASAEPGLTYAWAASLAKQGNAIEAAKILGGLQEEGLDADTLLLVGQTWSDIGDHPRALGVFRKALERNPRIPKAHYYSGIALIKTDKPMEAGAEFEAELQIHPDDPDARYNLGYAYLRQARFDDAVTQFNQVLARYPEHANAQYQLGKILLDQGKVGESIIHLEQAAKLSPEQDFVLYQLQAAYRKAERNDDAERTLAAYKALKAKNRERTVPEPNENK